MVTGSLHRTPESTHQYFRSHYLTISVRKDNDLWREERDGGPSLWTELAIEPSVEYSYIRCRYFCFMTRVYTGPLMFKSSNSGGHTEGIVTDHNFVSWFRKLIFVFGLTPNWLTTALIIVVGSTTVVVNLNGLRSLGTKGTRRFGFPV